MPLTRMTSEEIRKKYPLTENNLKQMTKACAKKPHTTDRDNPDIADLLAKGLVRRIGRPKKTECKKHINIRLEVFVVDALRETGRGWQTRLSDYITKNVKNGTLLRHRN